MGVFHSGGKGFLPTGLVSAITKIHNNYKLGIQVAFLNNNKNILKPFLLSPLTYSNYYEEE